MQILVLANLELLEIKPENQTQPENAPRFATSRPPRLATSRPRVLTSRPRGLTSPSPTSHTPRGLPRIYPSHLHAAWSPHLVASSPRTTAGAGAGVEWVGRAGGGARTDAKTHSNRTSNASQTDRNRRNVSKTHPKRSGKHTGVRHGLPNAFPHVFKTHI